MDDEPSIQRRLAAIFAADIAGYRRLMIATCPGSFAVAASPMRMTRSDAYASMLPLSSTSEPLTNAWQRVKVWCLSMLPIEPRL